jgi:hypothetical protein
MYPEKFNFRMNQVVSLPAWRSSRQALVVHLNWSRLGWVPYQESRSLVGWVLGDEEPQSTLDSFTNTLESWSSSDNDCQMNGDSGEVRGPPFDKNHGSIMHSYIRYVMWHLKIQILLQHPSPIPISHLKKNPFVPDLDSVNHQFPFCKRAREAWTSLLTKVLYSQLIWY